MKLRPTLRDVAGKAGVGKTTVSLALRNDPRISQKTRSIVQAIAAEIGYRPDPVLSQIAAQRWRGAASSGSTLAFVTTNHADSGKPLDMQAIAGAKRQAEAFGYRLEHLRFEDYADAAHLGSVIYHRGIRGVIVGQLMRDDFVEKFPWHQFGCVACNTGFHRPPTNLVMPDHSHAVVKAWQRAEARGYRRVGVALFEEGSAIDEFDKTAAALYCQNRLPENRRVPVLHFKPNDKAALKSWVLRHQPDVVLGFNESVYWWLRDVGFSIPNDVAFASLMLDQNRTTPKSMAGMDYQTDILGRIAVEHVDILLRTNQSGIPERVSVLMLEAKWCDGETLPERVRSAAAARR